MIANIDVFPFENNNISIIENPDNRIAHLPKVQMLTEAGFPMKLVLRSLTSIIWLNSKNPARNYFIDTNIITFSCPTLIAINAAGILMSAITCQASGELANLQEFLFVIKEIS